jgi:hypothetical protein
VARCTTSATFEAATVEAAITLDAVAAAEGCATSRGALGIGGAGATERDISTASAGTDRTTDTIVAVESATALGSSGATTTFIPAAVQSTVAGYPVGVAEDSAAGLAALSRGGTLATKTDRPAGAAGGAADTICAAETAAADRVPIAPTTVVVTAVQSAVGVDAVRCADRGSRRLTALPGLGTLGAEG